MAQVDILPPIPVEFDPVARMRVEALRQEHRETPVSAAPSFTLIVPNMVPKSAWGRNLRSILTEDEWRTISTKTRDAAHGVCSGCRCHGGPLEAHEDWHYDDKALRFTLKDVIPLCSDCHGVVHFGRSVAHGQGDEAFEHLMKVNGWPPSLAMNYVKAAFDKWNDRSERHWTGDYRWATREHGFDITGAGRLRAAAENRKLLRAFGGLNADVPDYRIVEVDRPHAGAASPERPRDVEIRRDRASAR